MKSPKVKRAQALRPSCLVETPLAKWWHRRRNELRRYVVCGIAVKNENLAGYSGRSALSGRLYCPDCEDVDKDAAFVKLRELA